MSRINVNEISPRTGTNLTLSGSVTVTENINGNGSNLTGVVYPSETGSFVTNSDTGSFATTGSNSFNGDLDVTGSMVITGSLTVSGSGTFNNIGPFNQTGNSVFSGGVTRFSGTGPGDVTIVNVGDYTSTGSVIASDRVSATTGSFSLVTSSGDVLGQTGSFSGGLVLTSPNGTQYIFTTNNDGYLSITGSAI